MWGREETVHELPESLGQTDKVWLEISAHVIDRGAEVRTTIRTPIVVIAVVCDEYDNAAVLVAPT